MAEQRVTDEQLAKLARQPWLAYQSDTVLDLVADLRASRAREAELLAVDRPVEFSEGPQ